GPVPAGQPLPRSPGRQELAAAVVVPVTRPVGIPEALGRDCVGPEPQVLLTLWRVPEPKPDLVAIEGQRNHVPRGNRRDLLEAQQSFRFGVDTLAPGPTVGAARLVHVGQAGVPEVLQL